MRFTSTNILPILILLITFVSVNQWSTIPLGNTVIIWIIDFLTIGAILWYKKLYFNPSNGKDYLIVMLYMLWMVAGVIRGMFVAENYFEWKQLIEGATTLSLPLFVYVFSVPQILHKTLKIWIRYALPAFFIFFLWVTSWGSKHYYLGPVFLLSCFLPVLKKKWQFIFLGLLVLMLFANFGARSQVIKAIASLLIIFAYIMGKYITNKTLKISHWMLYLMPVILLYLGISGTFNLFENMSSQDKEVYAETKGVDGETVQENLAADTRTFIYQDVILSAIEHNYIFWGRTPARGNDTSIYDENTADELLTGKNERHGNEVCFPNIFTWLGLIGMTLYCLIYLKSSYMAVYKSNNLFIKLVGVLIAFHFFYGWIEDFNRFDIANISIWMMISMAFSEQFRKMNNQEIKLWVTSLF
jgi:hypothetical protein